MKIGTFSLTDLQFLRTPGETPDPMAVAIADAAEVLVTNLPRFGVIVAVLLLGGFIAAYASHRAITRSFAELRTRPGARGVARRKEA